MEDNIRGSIRKARQMAARMLHVETEDGKKELDEWLASDEKHQALFERIQKKGQFTSYFLWRNSLDLERAWNDLLRRRHVPLRSRRLYRWAGGIAASLLLLVGGYGIYRLQQSRQESAELAQAVAFHGDTALPGKTQAYLHADGQTISLTEEMELDVKGTVTEKSTGDTLYAAPEERRMQRLVVPRGGEYRITLDDGTQVWLNAESTLSYPSRFSGTRREVEIEGEAYFEVARNEASPFYVQIGGQCIHVVGTAFHVRRYADESETAVSLLSGCVQMENRTGDLLCTLAPGQQCDINGGTGNFRVHPFDAQEVLAWKNGLFVFNHVTLSAIAVQLERWYDVEIRVDPALADNVYMGTLSRRQDMTALVRILESTGELRFVTNGSGRIFITPTKQGYEQNNQF